MTEKRIRLEARALDVGYAKDKAVVRDIGLTVRAGEVLVLLGPNGSGKSTLLKTLARQLDRLSGTVYLNGEDLHQMAAHEVARQMSLLLTDRPRAELMTCREVVEAGRYPYTGHLGILSREDREVADRCIRRMGAQELADRPFYALSDGQRQRVLLARALCQEPEVLLLDEPASYLDIRYQLELAQAMRSLAKEDGLSVIVSLHDIEMTRRCADRVLCLKDRRVDRIGAADEVLTQEYLEKLFGLAAGSLSMPKEKFEHYTRAGGKRLRMGYTTGTCAALAASAAAEKLLNGVWPASVSLRTPKGLRVEVTPEELRDGSDFASCGVRKDAGDDADVTDGALICAEVRLTGEPCIRIDGGKGVGTVTKPGLDQPQGEAAINSVPRRMITEAVSGICRAADYEGGIAVTVFVPDGEELAKKTFNPDLGIEGGLSILGTSGIVEPMSVQALTATIALELRQHAAQGEKRVILTPGNYGETFVKKQGWDKLGVSVVKCSNFIGEALDEARLQGYEEVLVTGHIGKMVKLAGGIMNTHSREADCRRELFTAYAALYGAGRNVCEKLMACATTDACLSVLEEEDIREDVMRHLLDAVSAHIEKRAGGMRISAAVFSNERGLLGTTQGTDRLLAEWSGCAPEE